MAESKLYDRNFAIGFVANVLFVMSNALMFHFARYVAFLGGDERDIGWILGFGAISGVVLRPWIGRWIDVLGPRRAWGIGYVLYALSTASYLIVDSLGPMIYVVRIAHVTATAIVFTSVMAYFSHTVELSRLAEVIGSIGVAGFVGMALGPSAGDLLLGPVEVRDQSNFVHLFGTATGLIVVALALLTLLRPVPPHPDVPHVRFLPAIGRHWPGTILWVGVVFGVCMTVPTGFLAKYVDTFQQDTPQAAATSASVGPVGRFFLVYATWAILLRLVFRTLPQRIGRRKLVLIAMSFMAVGMLSFNWVDLGWSLLIPAVLCGTGHSLGFHTMNALAIQSFPPSLRGVGAAVALMALEAGMVAGSPILGSVAYRFGYPAMFDTIAVLCLVTVIVYAAVSVPVWRARAEMRRAGMLDGAS